MLSRYIFEGIDTVGKSSCANYLLDMGYKIIHSPHNSNIEDLEAHYKSLLETNSEKVIFDRSFITEMVYGRVLRGNSRINEECSLRLLQIFVQVPSAIIYLTEDMDVLKKRLSESIIESPTNRIILENLPSLLNQYQNVLVSIQNICPVFILKSSEINRDNISSLIR